MPASETTGSPAAATRAFAGIEWLRFAACFGIVAFHQDGPSQQVGHAGLPAFAMLTTALSARAARNRAWATFRTERLRRLLLPWLYWSAFYAVVQCVLATLEQRPLWARFEPEMLVVGTYPHLWFLPFAAVAALFAGRCAAQLRAGHWLVLGAAAIPFAGWLLTLALPFAVRNWVFVLPAALLGIALAATPPGTGASNGAFRVALAGAAGSAAAWLVGRDGLSIEYTIATPAVALAWALPLRAGRTTTRLGGATLGIYVLHPFVAMLAALLAIEAGVPFTPLSLLLAVFAGSLLITLALRASPRSAAV